MKKGSWLVNTARGAICVRQDVADALASGHLNGYAGDVWGQLLMSPVLPIDQIADDRIVDVQPSPPDHAWRKMLNPLGEFWLRFKPQTLAPSRQKAVSDQHPRWR